MTATQTKVRPRSLPGMTKYVRVRSNPDDRFVEFDFAINDPALFVELIMPKNVFNDFCQRNDVVEMTQEQMAAVDAEMEKWRYGKETLMHRNVDRVRVAEQ